jgi:hypothetical protein
VDAPIKANTGGARPSHNAKRNVTACADGRVTERSVNTAVGFVKSLNTNRGEISDDCTAG